MRNTLIALLSLASPVVASDFSLALPVECVLGEDCYIQNYMDAAPGPDYHDFACGHLSYDGHKGTDFAVATHTDAMEGVKVLAAAPGIVVAVGDGVSDQFLKADMSFEPGKECGNGLVIDHGDGWVTQYCHLMRNSLVVRSGQSVSVGDILGNMGMSGKAAFPHLHLSVRHNNTPIDPFDAAGSSECNTQSATQLWTDNIAYVPSGFLDAGFATKVPDYTAVKWGQAHVPKVDKTADALVLWGFFYGGRVGQTLHFKIVGPDGVFFEQTAVLDRSQAQSMRAMGRRLRPDTATPGRYTGTLTLLGNGKIRDIIKTSAVIAQ